MAPLIDSPAAHVREARVLRVTGPDRREYLNNLLSQDFAQAGAGEVADFLYLDAKGNALAEGRAVVAADAVLLTVPAAVAEPFADALRRFTFLMQADTEDLGDDWGVVSVRSAGAVDVRGARPEPMTVAPDRGGFVVRDRSGGVDLIGPREWLDERLADGGWPRASREDWEAWRISAGQPAWESEITAGRRPQELGLLPTHVHLRKGCYPGQESIAKVYNLGRPRRALAVLELAGEVAPGDVVAADGKTGEITSAAPSGQGWVALALVPVDGDGRVVGDGTVVVGDVRGRVRKRVGEGITIPGS